VGKCVNEQLLALLDHFSASFSPLAQISCTAFAMVKK
jgi:hypothetical protein